MPLELPAIELVSWKESQRCPFVVYANLEAINVETKVSLKQLLGLEQLKDKTQLALGQSLFILEILAFSNFTSKL